MSYPDHDKPWILDSRGDGVTTDRTGQIHSPFQQDRTLVLLSIPNDWLRDGVPVAAGDDLVELLGAERTEQARV